MRSFLILVVFSLSTFTLERGHTESGLASTKQLTQHFFANVRAELAIANNERQAFRSVRSMSVHQADFALFNCGFYDRLECLLDPQACVKDPVAGAVPSFLTGEHRAVQDGYRYQLHLSGEAPGELPIPCSASGRGAFAFTAVPLEPGRTGRFSFCVDDALPFICVATLAEPLEVEGGRCRQSCADIVPLSSTLAELKNKPFEGFVPSSGSAGEALGPDGPSVSEGGLGRAIQVPPKKLRRMRSL